MNQALRRLRHPAFLLTLLVSGSAAALLTRSPAQLNTHLAQQLRQQIDRCDESAAARQVAELAPYQHDALHHWVDLLADDRPQVRAAACDALRQQWARWSENPSPESDRGILVLARELAAHDPHSDPRSRMFLKHMASRLLAWPLAASDAEQAAFLQHCTTILQRALPESPTAPQLAAAELPAQETLQPSLPLPPHDLPGGGVPVTPADGPPAAPVADESLPDPELPNSTEPALLPRPAARPLPPERFEPDAPRRIRTFEPSSVTPTSTLDTAALRSLETRSLMRHLHGTPAVAQAAEEELRRRGLDDQALRLARSLDDPDPQVRRSLAEAIPQIERIDHAAWLWQLAEDADAGVRGAALSILATSSNPLTRQRATAQRAKHEAPEEATP
jgi:hypothetical protein